VTLYQSLDYITPLYLETVKRDQKWAIQMGVFAMFKMLGTFLIIKLQLFLKENTLNPLQHFSKLSSI
jgi:hypothetical protein